MDNIQIVQQMYEAFSQKDIKKLETLCSPDILWVQNPGFPGGGVHKGIPSIIENVYTANKNRWESFNFEKSSFLSSEDHVIVQGYYTVKAHGRENIVRAETCHIYKIKDNKIISFQQYTDTHTLWSELV